MSSIGTNKFLSGFNSGIDKDTSISKYGNDTYFDSVDMRIISKGTLSNGSLVNVKGNEAKFALEIPNEEVIAGCQIKDDIVFFSRYGISTDSYFGIFGNNDTIEISPLGVYGPSYLFILVDSIPGTLDPQYSGYMLTSWTIIQIADYFNTISGLSDSILVIPNYREIAGYDLNRTMSFFLKESTSQNFSIIVNWIDVSEPFQLVTSFAINSGSRIGTVAYADEDSGISGVSTIVDDLNFPVGEKLNFDSSEYLSVVGRYESALIKKVYWANGIDPLRCLNVYTLSDATSATEFDHIPNVTFSPMTTTLSEGGNLKAGIIQYSYQYFFKNGPATAFAPVSDIIKLSDNATIAIGSDLGELVHKSVSISINNVDTLFDSIRIVSIFYDTLESDPVISIIMESDIGSSETISTIDTGASIGTISLSEYRTFAQTTISPAILAAKNNYLFAANITENTFTSTEIDAWDARAYAFSDYHGTAKIYDSVVDQGAEDYYEINYDGSFTFYPSTGGSSPGYSWLIPESFNCINRSNKIFDYVSYIPEYSWHPTIDPSTSAGDIVKFEAPLFSVDKVYGGLGPNVSYRFDWFKKYIYSTVDTKSNLYTNILSSGETEILTECYPDEVYRVGIKFFNKKGQSSFVKWIGDIKWPIVGNKVVNTYSYTPVLNITITNIPTDSSITHYQIVRVKVESSDISIKATGLISPLTSHIWEVYQYRPFISAAADPAQPMFSVNMIANDPHPLRTNRQLLEIFSPELKINNPNLDYLTGSKLLIKSYASGTYNVTYNPTSGIDSDIDSSMDLFTVTPILNHPYFEPLGTTLAYDIEDYANTTLSPNDADIALIPSRIGTTLINNQFSIADGDGISWPTSNTYITKASRSTFPIIKIDADLSISLTDYTYADNQFLIASVVVNNDLSRYGGASVQNRSINTYIPFSRISPIGTTSINCVYGDSYKEQFYFQRAYYYVKDAAVAPDNKSIRQYCIINVPSRIDSRYRIDDYRDYSSYRKLQETTAEGIRLYPLVYDGSIANLYVYNTVYSQVGDTDVSFVRPINFVEHDVISNKIIASETKSNGENIDSWTNFLSTNFIEVDGQYGSILGINIFNNTAFFFQEDAVGTLAINDRSLMQDNNQGALVLGTGGVLERFDYITTSSGPMDSYSILQTKSDIYYIDGLEKKIYSTVKNNAAISEIKGINSLLNDTITKTSRIRCGCDFDNKEVLFSIDDITLCYNENIESFVSRYSFVPDTFISTMKGLYSSKTDYNYYDNNYVYKHNEGDYGSWYSRIGNQSRSTSSVTLLIVPSQGVVNYFDSVELKTEVYFSGENIPVNQDILEESATRLKFANSYINEIDVESNATEMGYSKLRRFLRSWRMQVPLTSSSNRFVDSYLMLTIEFDNNNNKMFKLRDVTTNFRGTK